MDAANWRQGGRFRNPWPETSHRFRDVLRWKLGLAPRDEAWPGAGGPCHEPASRVPLDPQRIARPPTNGWRAVWFGHSSFVLQGAGCNLWVDPVFSEHCAPVRFRSLRRWVEPPCRLADLPRPDAILLTHGHYDHLDLPTLRQAGGVPLVVPEGHAAWLRKAGFREVREVPWFEAIGVARGVEVHAVPARHFTSRTPWDRNRGHWCGWVVRGGDATLWHAGDSGWCPAFADMPQRFGPIDFAMLPIGAYSPRWLMEPMHMNPEEAVLAFLAAKCRHAVAMHWGTFRLTDEPLGEPPLRLAAAVRAAGLSEGAFRVAAVGEVIEGIGGVDRP